MAYTANTPLANDRIKDSQPILNANFQAINTVMAVNHVAFNLADEGKHVFIQMPAAASAIPPLVATELQLFPALDAFTNTVELKGRTPAINGAAPPRIVSFTASSLSMVPNPANDADGWTDLPSGMRMITGRAAGLPANTNVNINLTISLNRLLSVIVCSSGATPITASVVSINSNSQFTVRANAAGDIRFLALGITP